MQVSRTSILGLPSEIWQTLGILLEELELFRLWCCGSKILNARLGSPSGVQNYAIRCKSRFSKLSCSDLAISIFRGVKKLEILLSSFSSCFAFHVPSLSSLPPTLTDIHFLFREAECCWRIGSYGAVVSSDFCSPSLSVFDWHRILPNLSSLWLEGDRKRQSSPFEYLRPEEIENLPFSLSRLKLPRNDLDKGVAIASLPPQLTELSFLYGVDFQSIRTELFENLSKLPLSELQVARAVNYSPVDDHLDEVLYRYAPPSLTNLRITTQVSRSWKFSLPPSLLSFDCSRANFHTFPPLPPQLQYLNVFSSYTSAWPGAARLPQFLSFYAGPAPPAAQLPSDLDFALLPPNLKTIRFCEAFWQRNPDIPDSSAVARPQSSNPSNPSDTPEERKDPLIPSIYEAFLEVLPRGLTDLSFSDRNYLELSDLRSLPSGLRNLHIIGNTRISSGDAMEKVGKRGEWLKELTRFKTQHFHMILASYGHWISLIHCIRKGDIDMCQYLVEYERVSPIGAENVNACHLAASLGNLKILSFLASIDLLAPHWMKSDLDGWTPLHHAVHAGHIHVLEWAIQMEAISGAKNKKFHAGSSTSSYSRNSTSNAIYLTPLRFGFFEPTTSSKDSYTHIAARQGHIHVLEWLETMGQVNPGKELNRKRKLPTHLAASNGQLEALKWLYNRNYPLDAKDRYGETAFDIAVKAGHHDIVNWIASQQPSTTGISPKE